MGDDTACYTFEAAIEMAVKMENETFRNFLDAIRKVENKAARELLKEAAYDELEHRLQLEKALVEGSLESPEELRRPVPTMRLDYILKKKELKPDSDVREVLVYAIHLEKNSIDFYKRLVEGCSGGPMVVHFERMLADESRHVQELEDLYEEHFLPQG